MKEAKTKKPFYQSVRRFPSNSSFYEKKIRSKDVSYIKVAPRVCRLYRRWHEHF